MQGNNKNIVPNLIIKYIIKNTDSVHTYIYMAISFRFRIIIKSQPEILIKFGQTLLKKYVLEILQQENCTSPFHNLIHKL